MTDDWVVEPSPSAVYALGRVGAGSIACTNISMEIIANDGKAWRRPIFRKTRRKKPNRKSPDCIFAQGNFTHVWKNLKTKFGTSAKVHQTTLVQGKKQVFYLLRNARTNDYIAIGNVCGAFKMWTRFQFVEEVPEGLMKDILALVAELWKGEKWGVVPTKNCRKSPRLRSLARKQR